MHGRSIHKSTALLVACAAALLCAACTDGGDDNARTVNVKLLEFSVTPDRAAAPTGEITFNVHNSGEDMHEFLVIKTDLAPDALPTQADGSYEENGPGTELIDEIEAIDSGHSALLVVDLEPGNYVLICNMVHEEDNGEVEVHYALGMRTAFVVE